MIRLSRLLIITDYYLPGFKAGGPIQSIYNLCQLLDKHFSVFVITRDRDYGDCHSYSEKDKLNGKNIYYLTPKQIKFSVSLKLVKKIDPQIIYLNSFFSWGASIKYVLLYYFGFLSRPIILTPRGEFSPGAIKIKSMKKRIYLFLAKFFGLYRHIIWHATSKTEKEEIQYFFGKKAKIYFVSNVPTTNKKASEPIQKCCGELKLVYISRITEKKNLCQGIKFLNSLNGKVTLDIFGNIEDRYYWQQCKTAMSSLPANIQVNYRGLLRPDQVMSTLNNYHALYLPTQGENYGHIIVETWQTGRPVIISDQTPWQQLGDQKLGWDIHLSDMAGWRKILQGLVDMDNDSYEHLCKSVEDYVAAEIDNKLDCLSQQYQDFFRQVKDGN